MKEGSKVPAVSNYLRKKARERGWKEVDIVEHDMGSVVIRISTPVRIEVDNSDGVFQSIAVEQRGLGI
jgi:hypothetical protein